MHDKHVQLHTQNHSSGKFDDVTKRNLVFPFATKKKKKRGKTIQSHKWRTLKK